MTRDGRICSRVQITFARRRKPNDARKEHALNDNPLVRHAGFTPDLADILLADVAIRIQLSKTDTARRSIASTQ